METNRQKKIAGIIQQDIAEILQNDAKNGMPGVIISVTKVSVTSDLSIAKIYISAFPKEKRNDIVKGIKTQIVKHELAQRTKHQLRRVPELLFYSDDTLDYIEGIDNALKGNEENPIENPSILPKRQKR